jgi:hypothetical protein
MWMGGWEERQEGAPEEKGHARAQLEHSQSCGGGTPL